MHKTLALSALCTLVGLHVACGGSEPPAQVAPEQTPSMPATTAPVDMPAADGGDAPTSSPTPSEPALSDEQIAKITATAHDGEIAAGKLAATNAKDPKVKKFAAMMVKHHGEELKKEEALAKKAKIMPGDSPVSMQMAKDNESTATTLKGLKGAEFDKAYMDAQVKGHQDVLDAIDKKLLPAAQNADLKAAITAFRPVVETHLKDAKEILAGLK